MNRRRWCMLCLVIGGSIMLLGAMLQPQLQALGRTPTDRVVENPLDDSGWSALGTGVDGQVRAITISGTELYVGGMFSSAGNCTTSCNNIAKWNTLTHSWSALGSGVDGQVQAIAIYDGQVYVGGDFANAGPVAANRIAVWDGSDWTALNEGVNGPVHAIVVSDGTVYVGGEFTQ